MGSEALDFQQELSADHRAKIDAWRRQHQALNAPAYRITLKGRTGAADGKTINLGKARVEGQPERFFDAAEVEGLIAQLRRHNVMGYDVYVTPIDRAHHYLVIDDMRPGAARLLAGLGHAPCLVQSSSAGNEQAVLKVPRVERPDEQQLANRLVQRLNQAHGDPRFSGVVHPFRLGGFANKKPGRDNAFTRILEAVPRLCAKAGAMLEQLRDAADDQAARARWRREQERIEADALREAERSRERAGLDDLTQREQRDVDAERAFRRAAAGVRAWVRANGWAEDPSRVDYRAALEMLRDGWDEAQVRAGLLAGSDGLAQRHRNVEDYVTRTVHRAGVVLAAELAAEHQASEASEQERQRFGRVR